jgi:predicted nucleic acid-binding protein
VILLDTGPLVALCDPADALNGTAVRQLQRLARRPLVASLPVLVEACALLPHAVQRRRLRRFLTDFAVAAYRVEDEQALWLEVLDWLERYREHDPDWTDGYLAVVSGREIRARVWTFDREFRTIWRRPDGRPIPLAAA